MNLNVLNFIFDIRVTDALPFEPIVAENASNHIDRLFIFSCIIDIAIFSDFFIVILLVILLSVVVLLINSNLKNVSLLN